MPQEQKIQQYIRFGQIIRIHGHKCLQNQGPDQSRGMITVKGFTDKDAKYTTFESFKNCQFYRQSLFQILPRGRFDKTQNVQEQEKKIKQYKALLQNKSGQHVKFGDDVVFKHVDSHDYLSGSVRCSDGGLGAFKVQLSQLLSQDLIFKLEPFRSFQKEGDQIKLQSPLRIKNISNRCYISTQSNKDKKKDQLIQIQQASQKIKKKMTFNIVTTYSRSFTWLIHLHEIHQTLADQNQIRTHDLLFLQHTKNQGYLCLEQNNNPLIKLPKKSIQFPFFTSIWQIQKLPVKTVSPYKESNDFNNLGTQGTFSLRQLLNNEYLEVKHKMPATIATDNKDSFQITIKSAKGLTQESEYLKNKGLIKIGGPKNLSEGEIDAGQQIIIDKSSMRYRNEAPFDINIIKFSQSQSQHGFRIQKIDDESKDQVLFILSTYEVLDAFCQTLKLTTEEFQSKVKSKKLQQIDITLRKLIAFIKNCKIQDIEADLLPNKKLQFICMDLKICQKLFKMLDSIGTKILQQIYKGLKGENEALKTVFNRAYYLIWQIINNNPITKIYVCQDWLQIILNHSIQLEEDTVHLTLSQILQNNDDVVTKFLKQNQNYLVKRIINIFQLKPPHEKFLNIFSASCVSGNLPIVSNQSLILKYFLQQLDKMSTFTFCYDIIQESSIIGDNMIADMLPKGKIKTVYIESYISKDHHDTRRLKDFFLESGRIDLYQTSNYFIAYLNLLADICYGKNAEARSHINQKLAPVYYGTIPLEERKFQQPSILDVLVAMLQDDQMNRNNIKGNINLQRAVLRLITYAYVESADQNPVLRINRYRNLDSMEGEVIAKQVNFFNIMQFIKFQITAFKSFYSVVSNDVNLDRKERQINSLQIKMRLYTILNVLKSTLINGFWTVEEQQNDILPLLLKILKNNKEDLLHSRQDIQNEEEQKKEFKKFKAEVSKKTPNIQKIIQCKALSCELIEIIFDFRFNNLVTETVAFYKDLQQDKQENLKQLHKIMIDISKLQSDAKAYILYSPQLWQQKMGKILDNDDPKFKELKQAISLLIPLMVELSIHIDSRLFFRSLKILKRHFYSTQDIKNQLLSLSLFDNTNGQYLVEVIKHKRSLLNKLQEQSALYLDAKDNPYKEITNFLAWLSQAIQIGTNLRKEIKSQNYTSIFQHFNQESRIDKFHQRLIKNNDLHPILLKFLGLSQLPLSTFSSNAKEALKYVYRFLTLLAKNFKEAKKEMIQMRNKILDHAKQESLSMNSKSQQREQSQQHRNRVQQQKSINYQNIGIHSTEALQILKRRNDCEAILFLAELFHDNKDILYDEVLMEQITIQISEMINDVEIQYYYKSHLLDFFRSLIYFKDSFIPINQSRILAKMQDSKKNQIYYMFQKGLKGISVEYLLQQWEHQNQQLMKITDADEPWPLKKNQDKPVIILQRLTYFIAMMNLFSNLVQGKQEVNIGKCRQVHSYTTLINILGQTRICYPLKAHLRNYINQLYYSTSIEQDLCVDIIKLELPLIIQDLNTIIVILSKTRQGRYYILHPIRYRYFESYIYLYIEQIVYSLNYLMSDQTFITELKKTLDVNYSKYKYYLHYFLIRIYERLRWILNYYYGHKYLRGFLNKVTNKIKDTFLIYFQSNAIIIFDKSQEKLHAPQNANNFDSQPKKKAMSQNRVLALQKRSAKLIHKLVQAQIGNYFTQERPEKDKNFPLVFFLPYDQDTQNIAQKKQKPGAEKQEQQRKVVEKLRMMLFSRDDGKKRQDYHSSKLMKLSQSLNEKDSFNLFMKGFIQKACKELYEVDHFSKHHYNFFSTFVSFQQYIRIFCDVNTSSPTEISTDLKIFFFTILLQYIVQHNTTDKLKEIQNWRIQDFETNVKAIEDAQIFLMNSNVAELLIQTLIYTQDLTLILAILQFGIAYLIGGNSICQNSILQKVKEDKNNLLFLKIEKIISKLGKKISNKIAQLKFRPILKEDEYIEFLVQSIDRYDYYEQSTKSLRRFGAFEEEIDEIDEQKLQKKVFGCLFKFMQLLCENNNIDFKNFIRQQIDTDNTKKNLSFNILNMTTFQIRRLFKVMNKEASIIILPLTDFLNEVVALPCRENQLSLCETTFFQDLCYMASFFTDKTNLKQGNFDTPQSLERLFELYQKCILVILNILQGNNAQLNKSFLLKLQVQFLLRLIEKYLKLLDINSEQDLHSMLYDPKKQQKHVPLMLQNTINVMVVLLKLEESQNSEQFKQRKRIYLIQAEKARAYKLQALINALKKEILKIQISSTLGKQYIYFPKHPILTKLSDATRNRIMEQVSRSTQRQKIKSLLQFKEQIFAQITHNFSIQKQKFLGIQISPTKIAQLQNYLSNLSYIIIILWMTTTDVIIQYGDVIYQSPKHIKPIIFILDIIQLTITILYSVLYFKCKYTLAEYRANKKISQQQEESKKSINNPNAEVEKKGVMAMVQNVGSSISQWISRNPIVTLYNNDQKFYMVVFYVLTSIFGLYQQKLFMLYVLFYFMQNQTLENVFKAITFNLNQLFSVSLLGLVFVYVFCLIFYETYALDIMASKDPKQNCDTIYACILDLYVSGTIGGSVEQLLPMRFATDLIYYIFFGLLFGNIVSGIMIDTFAERRAQRQEMTNDKKNKCYICGRDRGQLQKNNQKFDEHINEKHFLWNYIYYLYCLKNKDITEYTGLQYEIKSCVNKGENDEDYIKWIPFGGQEADPHSQKIQALTQLMQRLNIETKKRLSSQINVIKGEQATQE